MNSDTADSIVLDAPKPDSVAGEVLVSASGVFGRVIEELMLSLKGGSEFIGN